MEEFKAFVVDLLVAHNKFCSLVISKLVTNLVPREDQLDCWKFGTPAKENEDEAQNILDLLCRILNVIPMTFDLLLKQISNCFPFYKKPPEIIGGYLHNLLQLIGLKPMFQEDILHLIITKLLEVDVNIDRHEIVESESKDDDEDAETVINSDKVSQEKSQNEMEHAMAETLDIGMQKILEYVRKEMEKTKQDQEKICEILFRVFEVNILPTHNSHHVQFIIFYLCQFKVNISKPIYKAST